MLSSFFVEIKTLGSSAKTLKSQIGAQSALMQENQIPEDCPDKNAKRRKDEHKLIWDGNRDPRTKRRPVRPCGVTLANNE